MNTKENETLTRILNWDYPHDHIAEYIEHLVKDLGHCHLQRWLSKSSSIFSMSQFLTDPSSDPFYFLSAAFGEGLPEEIDNHLFETYVQVFKVLRGTSLCHKKLSQLEDTLCKLDYRGLDQAIKAYAEGDVWHSLEQDKLLIEHAIRIFNLPANRSTILKAQESHRHSETPFRSNLADWLLKTDDHRELSEQFKRTGISMLQTHFNACLYSPDSLDCSFSIHKNWRFMIVECRRTYDHLAEVSIDHWLEVANLIAGAARAKLPDPSPLQAEAYPYIDADSDEQVSEERILAATELAFGDAGPESADMLTELFRSSGI